MNFTAIRERVFVDAVRLSPKGLFSAAMGWGARQTLPRPLRPVLYQAFARVFGVDTDEVELPLADYRCLNDFFGRGLRPGARPIAEHPDAITSPCDGEIAMVGIAEHGHMIQAKGKHYTLADLVVDEHLADTLTGGPYVTVYLSPRDYHRVHSPIQSNLLGFDYIPGSQFPVNPVFSRSIDLLMAINERVVFHLQSERGAACLVMVGALGVSNLDIAHDRIETRYLRKDRVHRSARFGRRVDVGRGDLLGTFRLGSTVIVVFQPGSVELDALNVGDKVRFGQAIGHTQNSTGREESTGNLG